MEKKSVMIASQDAAQRARFSTLVNRLSGFAVVGQTCDLMNTYNEVERELPKAVLISDKLACLPEFEVMRALFSALDVKWLVITSSGVPFADHCGTRPSRGDASDVIFISGLATLSEVDRLLCSLTNPVPGRISVRPIRNATALSVQSVKRPAAPPQMTKQPIISAAQPVDRDPGRRLLLIGASTGGVDALLKVLSVYPADCPPTLIVQHTGTGFGESLVSLLNRQCAASVTLASTDTIIDRGMVVLGAGTAAHLVLKNVNKRIVGLASAPPMSGHCPSVDMLFRSAIEIAPCVTAALLTGMGRDGADGMKELRSAGARTMAQDEETCVVYGMPRAAVENGAAEQVLPIHAIGAALLNQSNRAKAPDRMTQ